MNGLFIMRQIDPQPDLLRALGGLDHVTTLDDGTHWVNDAQPRDPELNEEIAGGRYADGSVFQGCTVGFGIFDENWNVHAKYRSLDRAQKALVGSKVTLIADIDIEDESGKRPRHPDIIEDE